MIQPASLRITPEILGFISELDEFKGAWRALGTLAPERLSALRRVATIESIGSSTRIEGSKFSDREVERLLANLEIKSFRTRDEQEVAGYAETMELIFQSRIEITLTGNDQNRHAELAAMGLVLPARSSTADEAARQESRKRENCPICHTRIVRENPRVCTRTRTRHHRRYSYADRHESEHAQAALSPSSGKTPPSNARQRSRRLVWIGIESRTLGHR